MTRLTGICTSPMGMLPAPQKRTISGKPLTGTPPETRLPTPRAMFSVPSVTMNGCGKWSLVRPRPLINPTVIPIRMGNGTNRSGGKPSRASTAVVIIASANTDPTERSMPAVKITTNMPIANTALAAFCPGRFERLRQVRKTSGWVIVPIKSMTNTRKRMPKRSI